MKVDSGKYRISSERLRKNCFYEEELAFCNSSQDVPSFDGVIGQERAEKSMQFGLNMNTRGYNIFVVGSQGTGKSTYTQAVVTQKAEKGLVPLDWCYINNFNEWDKPIAVSLPAGQGKVFQKDIDKLIFDLKVIIPKAFENAEYQQKIDLIYRTANEKREAMLHSIEQEAFENGFTVNQVPAKILLIPMRYGRPIMPEEYSKISAEERQQIDEKRSKLAIKIEEKIREGQMLEKEANEQIIELESQTVYQAAKPLIDVLKEKYNEDNKIVEYLDMILEDVADDYIIFKNDGIQTSPINANQAQQSSKQQNEANPYETMVFTQEDYVETFSKYKVNLFIDNEKREGAPVVNESSPYYYNLFGKIEYKSQMLSMTTDFTMIKPGSIHTANGGYLILQAKDLLMDPYAWDALKKALKYKQATIENIGEQYRLVPTVTLKPEPIPLDIKVILIGSPLYYMIFATDEDFQKLFKVKVDFDMEMKRNEENLHQYVSFVSAVCRNDNLKHFDRGALARVIEYGSRLVGNQKKLSTHFNDVSDIIHEASAIAEQDGSELVGAKHVEKAINEQRYRLNLLEEKLQEQILEGIILIDTEGAVVGQLNGLYVIEYLGYTFGLPARITARTYMGRGGVINIERETKMSGSIHSKGVFTLAGYLGGKLAQEKPLGLTAQVTFEQLYDGIEGDSASSAELYAILSSLSGVPLKQNLAVTGSVNQLGEIQPIGGVTEKIEGFFDICRSRGLTGEQGVIIPALNINNLMLKDEVLEAVRDNKFHIYAVNTIDEGIELLTGVEAGIIGDDGKYPEGSIFYLADKKLNDYIKTDDDDK